MASPVLSLPRRAKVVSILLAVAITVNLLLFAWADRGTADRWKALKDMKTHDIFSLALEQEATNSLYSPSLSLRQFAPGAEIIVITQEKDYLREIQRYYGLGKARVVHYVEGPDVIIPGDLDLTPYVVSSGEGGRRGAPFFLALDPSVGVSGHRIVRVLVPSDDPDFEYRVGLVDATLIPEWDSEELEPWL